jgi:V/A-type H+/Na+-transporting ATPase subunit I
VIILLEGLIVTIQTLRLEYYEFLGKFYEGEGRKYEPFSLKSN